MSEEIVKVHDLNFKLYLSPSQIKERVDALSAQIDQDYAGKAPHFIAVLNGAFIFAADLFRTVKLPCTIDFVKLSSYEGLSSSGEIKTVLGLELEQVKGKDLILVEDIVDTGRTLSLFKKDLMKLEPASVKLASLLFKPDALKFDLSIDYLGFSIPPAFVIGYGLDYDQGGRNLEGIYQKI